MRKTLLIHANNTPNNVQKIFSPDNTINFKYDKDKYVNLDEYISVVVIEALKSKDFDLIYIKDTLSSSYLELHGLIVAYHIRLSPELENESHVPIVILSDIDGYTLNKIIPMAKILFTQNVYLEANNLETIKRYGKKDIKLLNSKEYEINFLKQVIVNAPDNSSRHSIANEWAMYRWATLIKVETDTIKENENSIKSMLYFKYLLALNPVDEIKSLGYKRPKSRGTVLYIDDEWNKGWKDILEAYFKNTNIKLETFKKNFKDANIFSLQSEIKTKVKSYEPDIILLDLRLVANDHVDAKRENIDKYTGIQIRKAIAEVNPGIQVIMFTATSRSVILEKLYEHNILGYIKKEHPQDKSLNTKDNIGKLAGLVDEGMEKKYLKKIWQTQQDILRLDIFKEKNFKPMTFEIESIFELLDSGMAKRYTYAMLSIFQALEEINNYYINDGTKQWVDGYTEISIDGKGYTKQKIEAVLKRLNLIQDFSSGIDEISKMRKKAIHPPKVEYEKPTKDNILTWFKMLQTILLKIDKELTCKTQN